MVINILVSLILTWRIGIAGCLIGTLAALTYRTIALSRYMFGNVRPGNAKRSIKRSQSMRQLQQSCYGYSGWTAAGRSITFMLRELQY